MSKIGSSDADAILYGDSARRSVDDVATTKPAPTIDPLDQADAEIKRLKTALAKMSARCDQAEQALQKSKSSSTRDFDGNSLFRQLPRQVGEDGSLASKQQSYDFKYDNLNKMSDIDKHEQLNTEKKHFQSR